MVKNISLFLVSFFVCQLAFGKSVDEQSAKQVGYNFLKNEGAQVDPGALSLAYKTSSQIGGTLVTDFYVFNAGTTGFVIISGDDNVLPVLGYSLESSFAGGSIPASINGWFDNYKKQIEYAITNNIAATEKVTSEWMALLQGTNTKAGHKTTATAVTPLLKSRWSQSPYVNELCPFDAAAGDNAVTGCVATAMAQVMKYWQWPKQGVSSHSYSSTFGLLTANYAATTYQWDSMPKVISKSNKFVATLMSHAGISVNMHYTVEESGAYVLAASSPVTNCAEYAMKTYFKYKTSIKGVHRYDYTDAEWTDLIRAELDWKRPVIYTGYGGTGGHCFVADGYADASRLHIDWGWGGNYNGYFVYDNLVPGSSEFNDGQELLVGIEPNNPATLEVKGVSATVGANIYPNPATDIINISLQNNTTRVTIADMQGRELKEITPAASATVATISVADLAEGLYIVSVQTAEGIETKKIVVTR